MCKLSPIFKQFLTIICCNLLTLSYGSVNGWATINFNELQNENSTFFPNPLSLDESSLVVSLVNVGGFIGNFAILPLSQTFGANRTIHILSAPVILSSLLIILAKNVYYLYISRLLSGFAGGSLIIAIPTLINDISHNNVRGALNSLYDPSFNAGIIISYLLGNYLDCLDQAKSQLILPMVFLIVMFLVPESPEFWMKQNKNKRALKSRRFFKGSSAALENDEFLEKPQGDKDAIGKIELDVENEENSKMTLKDFCTPRAKKAFFIGFTSLALTFFSGTLSILSYVTDIFTKTGSSLSAKNSSLLISITQITANLLLLSIVERINRRTLYIVFSFLATASFFLFAMYCLLWLKNPHYEWMPPVCLACIIFFSCMGLLPIPYIITIEIFPKKIRQTCLALAISMMWIILFVLGIILPVLLEKFGLFTCVITLGLMCLLNAIFGIFFIPETRGKSYEEIMDILDNYSILS